MDRWKYRWMDGQTGVWIDIWLDSQMDGNIDRWLGGQMGRQINRQIDGQKRTKKGIATKGNVSKKYHFQKVSITKGISNK